MNIRVGIDDCRESADFDVATLTRYMQRKDDQILKTTTVFFEKTDLKNEVVWRSIQSM